MMTVDLEKLTQGERQQLLAEAVLGKELKKSQPIGEMTRGRDA